MVFETGAWTMRNGDIVTVTSIGEYDTQKPLHIQELIKGKRGGEDTCWYANGHYFIHEENEFDLIAPVRKVTEKTGYNFQPGDEAEIMASHSHTGESIEQQIADAQWRRALAQDAMSALAAAPNEWARDPIVLADMAFRIAEAMIARSKS